VPLPYSDKYSTEAEINHRKQKASFVLREYPHLTKVLIQYMPLESKH
jgi:hypothetical protein